MQWVSLALVVVFGGASLITHDPRFIMLKPTLIYAVIDVKVILRPGFQDRPLRSRRSRCAGAGMSSPSFGYVWAGLMFLTGALNVILVAHGDTASSGPGGSASSRSPRNCASSPCSTSPPAPSSAPAFGLKRSRRASSARRWFGPFETASPLALERQSRGAGTGSGGSYLSTNASRSPGHGQTGHRAGASGPRDWAVTNTPNLPAAFEAFHFPADRSARRGGSSRPSKIAPGSAHRGRRRRGLAGEMSSSPASRNGDASSTPVVARLVAARRPREGEHRAQVRQTSHGDGAAIEAVLDGHA